MWERGLKQALADSYIMLPSVAPHVGAWIETTPNMGQFIISDVAPHVGAWIETCRAFRAVSARTVAPHVGAWIETVAECDN